MKSKLFISIVLAAILTVTMSVGCFASESTWILSDNKYVEDSVTSFPLAKGTRGYYYSSSESKFYYSAGVQSLTVVGNNNSTSSFTLYVRKTVDTYSDIHTDYEHTPGITYGFDVYALAVVPAKTYTTIDSHTSGYTTTSKSYSSSLSPSTNDIYYFRNIDNSYYGSFYSGQLNNSVVFGIDTSNQSHIFYD